MRVSQQSPKLPTTAPSTPSSISRSRRACTARRWRGGAGRRSDNPATAGRLAPNEDALAFQEAEAGSMLAHQRLATVAAARTVRQGVVERMVCSDLRALPESCARCALDSSEVCKARGAGGERRIASEGEML